jgi:hypothetical protein
MYQRILVLSTNLTGFGCKDNGDDYVKHMFIIAINPKEPIRSEIAVARWFSSPPCASCLDLVSCLS